MKQAKHEGASVLPGPIPSLLAEFSSVCLHSQTVLSSSLGWPVGQQQVQDAPSHPKTPSSDKPLAQLPQPNGAFSPSLNQSMPRGMGYTDWTRPGSHDTLGAGEGVTLTQTMWAEKRVRVDTLRKNQGALTRRRNRCGQANHCPSQWCPEPAPSGSERWLCTAFHMPPSATSQRECSPHRTSKHYLPGLDSPPESPL